MIASAKTTWRVVASLSDVPSAQALVAHLEENGVPARVRADTVLLGQARPCDVVVPSELAHRGSWILSQSQVSEVELTFLATGVSEDSEGSR
jgi:hypothetical protein